MREKEQLPTIRLESVYPPTAHKLKVLYELLKEREPDESISHSGMPTYVEHTSFVRRVPYREWCIVYNENNDPIGSFYVTFMRNEVGIAVFKHQRRKGYATAILKKVIEASGDIGVIANINPKNAKSIALFTGLGFEHIQNTYRYKKP